MERALKSLVEADLVEKMVFVGGPRQVGKTTLSLSFLPNRSEGHPAYLNWDHPATRRLLLQGGLPGGENLLVFDEIHKYKGWRNLIKGFYDTNKTRCRFLVTGSARLDHYRKGGGFAPREISLPPVASPVACRAPRRRFCWHFGSVAPVWRIPRAISRCERQALEEVATGAHQPCGAGGFAVFGAGQRGGAD